MLENDMCNVKEEESKWIFRCGQCDKDIYEFSYYYEIHNQIICEECVEEMKLIAEREEQ